MLDVSVVATRLDVSHQQVRNLILAGRLRGVEVGLGERCRRFKVPEDALEEFIQNQGNGLLAKIKTR